MLYVVKVSLMIERKVESSFRQASFFMFRALVTEKIVKEIAFLSSISMGTCYLTLQIEQTKRNCRETIMSEELIQALNDLQAQLIGPPDECTPSKPQKDKGGNLKGGTWFERTGAVGINGSRCYPMGSTIQHSRTMWSPHWFGKVLTDMDKQLEYRQKYVKVRCS